MKTIIKICLFFFCSGILFFSCQKGDSGPGCSLGDYGTVTVSNNSHDPYDLYIDDKYMTTISGKTITAQIHVKTGNGHKLFVRQVSGYIISPTEKTKTLDVEQCNDYDWQIP